MIVEHPPADLLVVGALAVDRIGKTLVPGGSVLYAAEAAAAAGWRVDAIATCGRDPVAAAGVARLRAAAVAVEAAIGRQTTTFAHRERGAERVSRLLLRGDPIDPESPAVGRVTAAAPRAVLIAPISDEVSPALAERIADNAPDATRVVALQGWVRRVRVRRAVGTVALGELEPRLRAVAARLDAVVASEFDLGAERGSAATRLARLREWCGPGPAVALTMGRRGALLDIGGGSHHVAPPRVIDGASTIGAGDVFAAILAVEMGAGSDVVAAATRAAAVVCELLAARQAT
jgi:sugar/nucleoside kinase (ribokinase family)